MTVLLEITGPSTVRIPFLHFDELVVRARQLVFLTHAKIRHFWGTVCPRERF
jgi:hypothetical protein